MGSGLWSVGKVVGDGALEGSGSCLGLAPSDKPSDPLPSDITTPPKRIKHSNTNPRAPQTPSGLEILDLWCFLFFFVPPLAELGSLSGTPQTPNCKIIHYKNPRIEKENNTLIAKPIGLISLGLKPIYLSDKLIQSEMEIAKKFSYRANKKRIIAKTQWKI